MIVGSFRDGKPVGVERGWHENGQLALERPYSGGVPHGTVTHWDSGANILYASKWIQGTGIDYSFHPNGKVRYAKPTVAGVVQGVAAYWNEEGELESVRGILKGQAVWKITLEQGNVTKVIPFWNEVVHGATFT